MWQLFSIFGFFIILVTVTGFYCLLVTRNLIRVLIGLEILMKAVTLLIIVAGYITNQMALAQSLVITVIVIEVMVIATAGGLIIRIYRHSDSLDSRYLKNLKG